MNITVDCLAWMPISEMGEEQLNWLRRKLTIADVHGLNAVLTRCYVEDTENDRFGIPRGFFYDSVTKDHTVKEEVSFGGIWPDRRDSSNAGMRLEQSDDEKELTLLGDFDDESRRGFQVTLSHFGSHDVADGILCFPASSNAYIVCMALVRALRLRTLILVADEASEEYWMEAISKMLPDAYIGLSSSNHIGVITVDNMRKLMQLGEHHFSSFGMIIAADLDIVDPVRWSKVVAHLPSAKRVGVSSDGLALTGSRRLVSYNLGKRIFTGKKVSMKPKIRRVWSKWNLGGSSRVNPLFISKDVVISSMTTSTVYNKHVVDQIILAVHAGRRVAVFSELLNHLRVLRKEVESTWVGDICVDYLVEGMGRLDISEAIKARVIFILYSMARKIPEIKDVDTVVLATPVKDPIDAVGCSLVPAEGKKDPIVVDMRCDGIPVCNEYGVARDGVYQSMYGEDISKSL